VTDISARTEAQEALRRSHAALEERTAELERRTTQLSRLTSELTLAEQSTREQLARTLHDGLQQLLVSASLRLERVKKRSSLEPQEARLLAQGLDDLDKAITASRSLSVELSPPTLHASGLPTAVSWLANWMKERYGLDVQATVDPLANSDRKDVRTLVFESLRELLFNAVKHAQVDRVAVTLVKGPDETLRVSVRDHGVGFDPARVFTQANSQTAGIGLFSIRERLTLLGGQFEVTSSPGQGTHFQLIAPAGSSLPAKADKSLDLNETKETPHQADPQSSPRLLRILIVDDFPALREGLRKTLEDRPEFQVVGEAANGFEAVTQARSLRPDAIIMDISMPEMDGIEATRRIHAEFPLVQIFGLSAHEFSAPAILQAGGSGCFLKGTDMNRLVDRLLASQIDKNANVQSAHAAKPNSVQ
jgi:CheY-like chemotaxis protein